MSAYPAYTMGALCIFGGIMGFVRTRSVPSLFSGVLVGVLYLYSAESLRQGKPGGIEGALGASVLLFLSALPRLPKTVPIVLATTSAAASIYYGKIYASRR